MPKVEDIKLSTVIEKITTELKEAIAQRKTGVAFMYICGIKTTSVSVENLTDDVKPEDKSTAEDGGK